MLSEFTHLHVHSEYSFESGFFNILDYVKFCYENNYKTAVITERFNLFSAIRFYNSCLDFGIKPIIGCELFLECDEYTFSRVIFLCKNYTGYKNLISILSKVYLKKLDEIPFVKAKWLINSVEGLICVGISTDSDIGKSLLNNDFKNAFKFFNFWNNIFKDSFYLSLTRFGFDNEIIYFTRLLEFISDNKINLLVTNEVLFLRKIDIFPYKAKIAMFNECDSNVFRLSEFDNKYFKSSKEMFSLFKDIPDVLLNTIEVCKRCNLFFKFGANYSPKFINSYGISVDDFLFKYTFNKLLLDKFFFKSFDFDIYFSRLKSELNVIYNIGFANYFLVTHEFIMWAKYNDVFVGPGRGSGAGSLVAYLLSITGIDPINNDLLFERFLNKDRVSSPDFDVDFCIEGRDLVIDYIFDFYGIKNVSQIVTFGCMTVKSVIRDVGKILGYSYVFIDKVIKLLSGNFGLSLKSELVNNFILRAEYDASFDIQAILNLSLRIEGVIKGIGTHAGGLIISSVELIGYLPIQYEESEFNFITQFDKDDSELFGFSKFDFLGLKTLTIFSDVIDTLCSYYSITSNFLFNLDYAVFDDMRVYTLLERGDTLGIFQFESNGIKSILQKVKPNVFSDIISLIALYRPGPLQSGLLLSFAKRKMGSEQIDYVHPKLKPILMETYGMIVYQEQVMLIAQIFANYSLGDADFLRRAMSKKKGKDMEVNLANFVYGSALNGIDYDSAEKVFYLVEKFAGYGFNKAHSVGYALLAYISAWLKANYNIIFLASLLSSDMDNNIDVDFYFDECDYFGIDILPPDINRSFYSFTIINEKSMLFGFGFVKGIGKSLISDIIWARSRFGFFNNFFDFFYRIDINLLTKKVLHSLVYSGFFDKLNNCRFKLALISNKIFDLYFAFNLSLFLPFYSVIDKFFNISIRNFYYMVTYKNTEFTNSRYLLGKFLFYHSFNNYVNDFTFIHNLSYNSGIYFNEFFCGVIEEIRLVSKFSYFISILGLYDVKKFYISTFRYRYKKNLFKVGKLVVTCLFLNNGIYNELFIEDFYLFRCFFAKYFDIYFSVCFISDKFFNRFFSILKYKAVKGKTKIRFFYYFYGVFSCIELCEYFDVMLHDDFIEEIRRFKEICNTYVIYNF